MPKTPDVLNRVLPKLKELAPSLTPHRKPKDTDLQPLTPDEKTSLELAATYQEALKEGDKQRAEDSYNELYERYVDKIYNYIYYRVGNVQDAEDLTARVFFKAFEHLPRFENNNIPFSAWLYRIAHNLVANYHRDKSRRREQLIEDSPDNQMHGKSKDDPVRLAESEEAKQMLLAAIRRLPDDRQQLILLKFSDNLPNAQIGRIMGRSEGAIKSLYHRTLLALREDMIQYDV